MIRIGAAAVLGAIFVLLALLTYGAYTGQIYPTLR